MKRNNLKKIFTGKYLPDLDIEVHPSKKGKHRGTKFRYSEIR